MEYATRSGAVTSRFYGETEDLLPKYAWYSANAHERTWPVGSLKPNDLGLFDAQGNTFTWCEERYKLYPSIKGDEAFEDREDQLVAANMESRVLRGGSFVTQASYVRSAYRMLISPALRNHLVGLRPARTFR
jgi:formylglycine-generating enzyme required for sulfatase activity